MAETVAAVGRHAAEPVAKPFFANLFFYLFDAAEFDPRGASRFLGRHACTNVLRYQQFEVGMNLLVEVYLHAMTKKQISQETLEFHQETHAEDLSTMLPMLGQ